MSGSRRLGRLKEPIDGGIWRTRDPHSSRRSGASRRERAARRRPRSGCNGAGAEIRAALKIARHDSKGALT
ncbi:unnamed protein product, partial [Nesidiocoris tenuis]